MFSKFIQKIQMLLNIIEILNNFLENFYVKIVTEMDLPDSVFANSLIVCILRTQMATQREGAQHH